MGKLERLAAARERVRRWKEAHPKSVIWQRERRYARQKEKRRISGVEMVKRASKALKVQYAHYGETHLGDIEGVDVAYGNMEPKFKGGRDGVEIAVEVPHGTPAEETPEERRVNEHLGILRARQAAGGLNAGVEIQLEGI